MVIAVLFVVGCGASSPPGASERERAFDSEIDPMPGGDALFAEHGVEGAFVVRKASGGRDLGVGGARVDERFIPASTFKIPNTIIGVETGVIPDASFSLPWDGVERRFSAWNRDHDVSSAIGESAVWWYQEVARRVGLERMRAQVTALRFGNAEIGTEVDHFWLDGPLAISPREQVDFLGRLTRGELPVSDRSTQVLREVLPSAPHGDATVRSKTGTYWSEGPEPSHAWRVGWVEREGEVVGWFALLLTGPQDIERMWAARDPLTDALLERAGLLVAEP